MPSLHSLYRQKHLPADDSHERVENTSDGKYLRPFDDVVSQAQFQDLAALIISGIYNAKDLCNMLGITRRRLDLLTEDPRFNDVYEEFKLKHAKDWKYIIKETRVDPVAKAQALHVKGQEMLAVTMDRLLKRIEKDHSSDPDAMGTTAAELRAAIQATKIAMDGAHVVRHGNDGPNVAVQVNVPVFTPNPEQAKIIAETTASVQSPVVDTTDVVDAEIVTPRNDTESADAAR